MGNETSVVIACDLDAMDAALRERHDAAWHTMQAALKETIELENGFKLYFPANEAMLVTLATFIAGERLCCPFFDFGISAPHGHDEVCLMLTGPDGVKELLREALAIA